MSKYPKSFSKYLEISRISFFKKKVDFESLWPTFSPAGAEKYVRDCLLTLVVWKQSNLAIVSFIYITTNLYFWSRSYSEQPLLWPLLREKTYTTVFRP